MSNKVSSASVVFGVTACDSSLICDYANLVILRELTDKAVNFARACRGLFSESPSAILDDHLAKIERFSAAYKPETFATYTPGSDQRLFPLSLAKNLLANTATVKELAKIVEATAGGKELLANSYSWQILNNQMKESGALLIARVHQKVGMLEQRRDVHQADITALSQGRHSLVPVFA